MEELVLGRLDGQLDWYQAQAGAYAGADAPLRRWPRRSRRWTASWTTLQSDGQRVSTEDR